MSSLFLTDRGTGFPVILIHGFCETHAVWETVANDLQDAYRVISIDLPGFGRSPLLPKPFTLASVANSVKECLDERGIGQCIVVGHSLGGYVALSLVNQYPHRIKAFSLFHSTAFADSEERKASRNKVIEFVEQHGVEPFIRSFIPPLFSHQQAPYVQAVVDLALTTPKETLIAYTAAMRDRPDHTDVLQGFAGEILFVAGEKDTVVPVQSIEKQVVISKSPTLVRLSASAHMGMFEEPAAAAASLRKFFQEVAH